jgi:L-fucose isomerase-like protein
MNRRTRQLKLGVCPIGKFVFSHEDALRQKAALFNRLRRMKIPFIHADGVLPDGMVRDQAHVEPVVRYFRDQGIEALMIPHCNFGTEGAAGMIAHRCGVPTLLWGPRDGAPESDGTRLRDTLCGLLATSRVLHTLRVPFACLPNENVDHPSFAAGLHRFIGAARVAKTLRTMRIGMIGQRIDFFWSTIVNEADLLQRFGVQVQPIELALVLDRVRRRAGDDAAAYRSELEQVRQEVRFDGFKSDEGILYNLAFRDELLELGESHGLDGFAIQTFNAIPESLGMFPCLGVAMVNDAGYPVGPESDLHGAVTSVLLEAASAGDEPSFLPDIASRHPTNDNAVLLWHFEAPLSLRHPQAEVRTGLPWILKGLPPGLLHFQLKDGPLTLARFDGDAVNGYRLGFGQGHTVQGPYTQEFYAWMEVDHWPTWERQLMRGPYIHHCSCVYDHCADVLEEATCFIPGLVPEPFGRARQH